MQFFCVSLLLLFQMTLHEQSGFHLNQDVFSAVLSDHFMEFIIEPLELLFDYPFLVRVKASKSRSPEKAETFSVMSGHQVEVGALLEQADLADLARLPLTVTFCYTIEQVLLCLVVQFRAHSDLYLALSDISCPCHKLIPLFRFHFHHNIND